VREIKSKSGVKSKRENARMKAASVKGYRSPSDTRSDGPQRSGSGAVMMRGNTQV